ncbi:MAG TPA: hypothetical protein VGR28_11780 [Candidatus Thermoplasmatota archaeon]|jgi:hypothetical protein|nr:hypothetical protein [Candidatus Thermoplasmatota archaeon]
MTEQASLEGAPDKPFVSDANATAQAYLALEKKLNPRYKAWAIFREVEDEEGRGRADAICIGFTPKTRYEVWGCELKASRGDWVKELDNPTKSLYFFGATDRWWLIGAKPGIVKQGELPAGWGLMELEGDRLRVVVQAPLREKAHFDRGFLAHVIRRAFEQGESGPDGELWSLKMAREYQRGVKHGRESGENAYVAREYEKQKAVLVEFRRHTGIGLSDWNVEKVGHVIRALYNCDDRVELVERELEQLADRGRSLVKLAEEEAAKLGRRR